MSSRGATITIHTTAFEHNQRIPDRHSGEGQDASPPLRWSGVPEGTKQLALICDDPDAPTPEPWVHWVLYHVPADTAELTEALPRESKLDNPAGALQGVNSFPSDNVGYRGPMPPKGHGTHHYQFKLYALDTELNLPPRADKAALLEAMEGHVIGEGELIGTFER